jgi:hypothetical protein
MISKAIIRAYQEKYLRGWDTLYFAIDLHGTIIERYTGDEIKAYDYAEEALRKLSSMPDVVPILYTSTSEANLLPFNKWCFDRRIFFKYLNENTECDSNKTGDFSKKFYFNVLLDDRAGFDPEVDWQNIIHSLDLAEIMIKCPKIETCRRGLKFSGDSLLCKICSKNVYIFDEVPQ